MVDLAGEYAALETYLMLRLRFLRCLWLAPLLSLTTHGAYAQGTTGRVVEVTDGDTLTVLVGKQQIKVRLVEIDAPEGGQAFGNRSKQSLSEICFGKTAVLIDKGTDRFERMLARVECDRVDANEEQVRRGMAWVYDQYVTDHGLYAIQDNAKSKKLGLWTDPKPTPPWEWRHSAERTKAPPPKSLAGGCRIKGNINSRGDRIYHLPGQKYYGSTQINESSGERWFCSEADARAAGWRAAKI